MNKISIFICFVLCIPCQSQTESDEKMKNKFEPKDGKILVFVGQDSEALGGVKQYKNGYLDHFETPTGITLYSNLSPGDQSYSFTLKGLDGLETKANWGAGDTCAQYFLDDEKYQNTMLAIGLSMVNHEKNVAKGKHDALIKQLAIWIQKTNRPIFLRIGYEFDGWDWNNYSRKHFVKAFQRIHDIFKKMKVTNVAFVWQSKGTGSNQKILEDWYPGDAYVDWCGYSYFNNPDEEMLHFARKHNKPVFIAEACPVLKDAFGSFYANLSNENEAKLVWEQWFVPFFKTIENNKDVIKAFSYINVEWKSQMMWANNEYFKNVDSRLQVNEYIAKKWLKEIKKEKYGLTN